MAITAKLSYKRIAPRKVRLLADLIRGKSAHQARAILNFLPNKSAGVILKLLNQAVNSAKNNFKIDEDNLYISKIIVDAGPILKRFRPRARGSAYEIQKKTSHIKITLQEIEKGLRKESTDIKEQEVADKETIKEKPRRQRVGVPKPTLRSALRSDVGAKASEETILKPKVEKPQTKIFRRQTF